MPVQSTCKDVKTDAPTENNGLKDLSRPRASSDLEASEASTEITGTSKPVHVKLHQTKLKGGMNYRLLLKEFNRYWKKKRGLDIKFEFGEFDWKYGTASEPATARNMILNEKLSSMGLTNPITIVEAFVGTASDTITFLADIHPHPARIFSCDMDDQRRALAQGNVDRFEEAFQTKYPDVPHTEVEIYDGTVDNLFYKNYPNGAIDLLYVDPPWEQDKHNEVNGPQLVDWMNEHVFDPMKQYITPQINLPKIIIIKTRFGASEMKTLNVQGYIFVDTLDFTPFGREVHFHTLQSITNRTHHVWHPSRTYIDVYRRIQESYRKKYGKPKWEDYGEDFAIEYVAEENGKDYWTKVIKKHKDGKFQKEDDFGPMEEEQGEQGSIESSPVNPPQKHVTMPSKGSGTQGTKRRPGVIKTQRKPPQQHVVRPLTKSETQKRGSGTHVKEGIATRFVDPNNSFGALGEEGETLQDSETDSETGSETDSETDSD